MSTTNRFLHCTGQAHKVSRPLGGQLHTRMFGIKNWDARNMLRLVQPKKDLIKIELHHGIRKSVATLRTVRTLIVRQTHRTSRTIGRGRTGLTGSRTT